MRHSPLRIALLGRCDPADEPSVASALGLLPKHAHVERLPDRIHEWPQQAGQSDLCIVFQTWPDEIESQVIHGIVAATLAGRLICCEGAWCASAGRTRAVWPQAVCVPIEQLSARLRFELAVLAGDRAPLPATASRDEAFAAHYALLPGINSTVAAVESPDPVYAREFRRALNSAQSAGDPDGIIIDADGSVDGTACRGDAHSGATCVAVAGFSRPERLSALRAAGILATVSKLAPLSEFVAVLARTDAVDRPAI